MKKKIILSVIASFMLVGCGGGGGGTSSTSNGGSLETANLKVIDGYVVGARVCDANNHCATSGVNGEVEGSFDNTPLTSTGGKVDLNFNGIAEDFEPDAITMKAYAGAKMISPITTLIAEGADPDKLAQVLNIDVNTLENVDPLKANNQNLVKAYQIAAMVIQRNQVQALIRQINSYTPSSTTTYTTTLPDINNPTNSVVGPGVELFGLFAKNSLLDYNDKGYVDYVISSNASSAIDLDVQLERDRMSMSFSENTGGDFTTTYGGGGSTGGSDTNNTSSGSTSSSGTSNTGSNTTGGNVLPDVDGSSGGSASTPSNNSLELEGNTGTSSAKNDTLPKVSNGPAYTLPEYVVKINGQDIEVNKINDHLFEFKSPVYFNQADGEELNLTLESDFNFSSVFNDTITTDGNYMGTLFLHYYDETNISNEVNITIKNVKYKIVGSKLVNIYFNGGVTTVDLNSSDLNDSATLSNDYTFNPYEVNVTHILENDVETIKNDLNNINQNKFNTLNHKYIISYNLNFAGITDSVKGVFKIIDSVAPTLDLENGEPYIFPRNTDINVTVGTTNKSADEATCSVTPSGGLECKIYGNNINLVGKTDDTLEKINATITVKDNNGNEVSKSIVFEILNPAGTKLVQNWDLDAAADGNYSDKKIFMSLTGSISSGNVVDVYTSATNVPDGSPENNVTVYLYKDEAALRANTANDYVKFIFDADVYGENDVFVIKNDDGKVVKFRVGDVTSSNNSFYFTDDY